MANRLERHDDTPAKGSLPTDRKSAATRLLLGTVVFMMIFVSNARHINLNPETAVLFDSTAGRESQYVSAELTSAPERLTGDPDDAARGLYMAECADGQSVLLSIDDSHPLSFDGREYTVYGKAHKGVNQILAVERMKFSRPELAERDFGRMYIRVGDGGGIPGENIGYAAGMAFLALIWLCTVTITLVRIRRLPSTGNPDVSANTDGIEGGNS